MSLSTPFKTGLVFDPGPSQADSWHGPYYTVVRPGVRCCFGRGDGKVLCWEWVCVKQLFRCG